MAAQSDRLIGAQGALVIPGPLFATLASFFLGNYFELGTVLFIV